MICKYLTLFSLRRPTRVQTIFTTDTVIVCYFIAHMSLTGCCTKQTRGDFARECDLPYALMAHSETATVIDKERRQASVVLTAPTTSSGSHIYLIVSSREVPESLLGAVFSVDIEYFDYMGNSLHKTCYSTQIYESYMIGKRRWVLVDPTAYIQDIYGASRAVIRVQAPDGVADMPHVSVGVSRVRSAPGFLKII